MDSSLKYQLIEKIVQTTDEGLLQEIKFLLEDKPGDWWDQVSEAERTAIEEGLTQADRGETLSHEEAMSQIRHHIQQRRSKA